MYKNVSNLTATNLQNYFNVHHVYGDTFQFISTIYFRMSVPIPKNNNTIILYKKKIIFFLLIKCSFGDIGH